MHRWDVFLGRVRYECVEVWSVGKVCGDVEVCGGVWRCGVCEGELSAQVGCISRKGEI